MPKFRNIRIKKPGGGHRMQRAQVLKSGKLKFVKNKPRGGGSKKSAAKKPARKRSKSVAKKSNPNNKKPKIGAAIQAFKGTQPLLSPVIDSGLRHGLSEEAVNDLRPKANAAYAGNVAMTALNQAVDRKLAHGAALSRGSVTAWLPEAFAALQVANEIKGVDGKRAAILANSKLSSTLNGYFPFKGSIDLTDPTFRTYQGLKIGGGLARRLSNTGPFKRITAPVKRMLGEMGGAL